MAVGTGRGGARPNSGPARTPGSVRYLREQRLRGKPAPAAKPKARRPPVVAMAKPKGIPAGQSSVWEALAPHALAARTLTPATAWHFRELCEAIVLKRDMARILEADGLMQNRLSTKMDETGGGEQVFESKAHPLIARWTALLVRVEAGLTRFRLAPMGKELAPVEEPVADPFSAFDEPLMLVKGRR